MDSSSNAGAPFGESPAERQLTSEILLILVFLLAFCLATAGHGQWSAWTENIDWQLTAAASLAALLGALAGLGEVISHYKDEPLRPLRYIAGRSYVVVNAIIAFLAFEVVERYASNFPLLPKDLYIRAVLAGFGALVIFRSKIFVVRSEDGSAIGPEVLITAFLKLVDRTIDRERAIERHSLAFHFSREITDFNAAADFLLASLVAFQRLGEDDIKTYNTTTEKLKALTEEQMTMSLKAMSLVFVFMDIAGEDNLRQTFMRLQTYMKARQAPQPPPEKKHEQHEDGEEKEIAEVVEVPADLPLQPQNPEQLEPAAPGAEQPIDHEVGAAAGTPTITDANSGPVPSPQIIDPSAVEPLP